MPDYTTGRATPIKNRNFLAPTGFKFTLDRAKSVSFFCNQANIPDISLGVAEQPTWLKDLPVPGDKMQFGDLNLRFLVDEDLKNYMSIQHWIRGLGYPEDMQEFRDLESEATMPANFGQEGDNIYSDGTLQILNSSLVPNFQVVFKDLFPYSLTTLSFDATDTDIEYFSADVSFKYSIYNLTDLENNPLSCD
tara:strand:- start:255 stop:830 length:576 start_codon:yes stop_codon:yes gene_type:complete